jgi:radical SAM protein with 4Fe4S-binding SPASM domain
MSEESSLRVTRNPDAFAAARRGRALLVEHGLPFVVKGALLPATRGEVEALEDLARRAAWDGRAPSHSLLFDLRTRRDGVKSDLIRGLRIGPEEFLRFSARGGPAVLEEWADLALGFADACGDRLFDCLASGGSGSVDAYGRFQCCLALRHPDTVYDLERGSLREALTDFLPKVRALKAADPSYLERCGRCPLKGLCHQCPAKSWAEHGTLDTPVEYFCGIAHAQAEALGLLARGEKTWEVGDWPARLRRLASRRGARSSPPRTGGKECEGGISWKN